jgi:hypothetical protein
MFAVAIARSTIRVGMDIVVIVVIVVGVVIVFMEHR